MNANAETARRLIRRAATCGDEPAPVVEEAKRLLSTMTAAERARLVARLALCSATLSRRLRDAGFSQAEVDSALGFPPSVPGQDSTERTAP